MEEDKEMINDSTTGILWDVELEVGRQYQEKVSGSCHRVQKI